MAAAAWTAAQGLLNHPGVWAVDLQRDLSLPNRRGKLGEKTPTKIKQMCFKRLRRSALSI